MDIPDFHVPICVTKRGEKQEGECESRKERLRYTDSEKREREIHATSYREERGSACTRQESAS
jgi:hypothetical protein